MLEKSAPFEPQYLEEEREEKPDVFTIRLNKDQREEFNQAKKVIEQSKDSTAMKQLAWIGIANVIHDKKTALILGSLFKNKRNNKRNNIVDFD